MTDPREMKYPPSSLHTLTVSWLPVQGHFGMRWDAYITQKYTLKQSGSKELNVGFNPTNEVNPKRFFLS